MDLFKEIIELQEAFNNIFEGGNAKGVVDRAYLKGKIDADKAFKLGKKALRIPSDNDYHVNDEGDYDFSGLTGKTATKANSHVATDMRRVEKGRDREELEAKRTNDEKNNFKQATAKAIRRNKEKLEKIKEAIDFLREEYKEIFEASKKGEEKEVNKLKYEKDKGPGKEPTEVVSVADELFPYKGSAKEQFNKKIIAKINDMIEGTATLEDLINLVRRKKIAKVSESMEEAMVLMETIVNELLDSTVDSSSEKRAENRAKACAEYLKNPNPETWNGYKAAEKKDEKNLHLSMARDKRHGVYNTPKAGRVSTEKVEKDPGKYMGDDSVSAITVYKKALDKNID